MNKISIKQAQPYIIMFCIYLMFIIFSLTQQSPGAILKGLVSVNMSRGVLITDYIAVGGIGGAFMNAVIVGVITIILIIRLGVVPTGATIMAMFLTAGFALFGKSIINMIPVTAGVWLYAKVVKKPFADFYVTALLAATISPISSEIIFLDIYYLPVNILLGVFAGMLAGFLFPMMSAFLSKALRGFNLYNMGFAGGLLATSFSAFLMSMGIETKSAFLVSSGNNAQLAALLYFISLFLVLCGLFLGDRKKIVSDLIDITKQPGMLTSDYYEMYGMNIYVNMGVMCFLGTSLVLLIGGQINGPAIAGIFAMAGFAAYGKHVKNALPLIIGAVLSSYVNKWDPSYPTNVITILFCTGLSPIAGKYGVAWGIVAGFMHTCMVHHIGYFSGGVNLYGNGFAAGFVALTLLPIIEGFTKIFPGKTKTIGDV